MAHPSATLEPTQRRITLLRHAKAVPDERGDDHGRILAPQGKEAAVALGDWLRENDLLPELVLCSTATRTRETLAAHDTVAQHNTQVAKRRQRDGAVHKETCVNDVGICGLSGPAGDQVGRPKTKASDSPSHQTRAQFHTSPTPLSSPDREPRCAYEIDNQHCRDRIA